MKKLFCVLLASLLLFCGGCAEKENNTAPANALVVENGGRQLIFDKTPQRLVTLRQHITETALEMDLDQYIIGTADIIDPPVAAHLQKRYSALPVIAEKYPSQEVLFAAEPEIIWVDRKWAFVKNQLGSLENIEQHGIKVYLSESGFHNTNDIKYVYEDIAKMGALFNKQEWAQEVIANMRQRIAAVQDKVKNVDRVRVLDFDSGRSNLAFVGCRCMADELIKLAGGENIFSDIDKEWASVNWEEIMRRDPEVIIVHEYRGVSGASKIEALKHNPVLSEVSAIKNNRFITINLDEIYEGVRNAETVEKFAEGFYPELF